MIKELEEIRKMILHGNLTEAVTNIEILMSYDQCQDSLESVKKDRDWLALRLVSVDPSSRNSKRVANIISLI